ncbi:RimJ/RimL family protein N-acetyltransferase [Labedella gwakjiensis]|uniref:N-acetyltransferase n=1 Tax=Labedella gwakjiensis TaxID=390269 RepID=A0A2P8GVB2_9MICO|nr:GNAT family protein [Labedella gwakjiensis]PSL37901.1 RimJ/RimL family protein N-acetyltransferase [Labedella gwakjiensis]RUQ87530.1 N-acetyltransferase [Labedella gwakjiensis]
MPPEVTLHPVQRPADDDALVDFISAHEYPFHMTTRPTADDVRSRIASGSFDAPEHAAYWVVADGRRVGVATLEDLEDDAPLFDLRLANDARGRGLGVPTLQALTREVFERFPAVNRFEGQTREDNIPMRRTFLRAGWVKEAHYRDGWPVAGGDPVASVAYAILRRDWETGKTTPVPWDDEPGPRGN